MLRVIYSRGKGDGFEQRRMISGRGLSRTSQVKQGRMPQAGSHFAATNSTCVVELSVDGQSDGKCARWSRSTFARKRGTRWWWWWWLGELSD